MIYTLRYMEYCFLTLIIQNTFMVSLNNLRNFVYNWKSTSTVLQGQANRALYLSSVSKRLLFWSPTSTSWSYVLTSIKPDYWAARALAFAKCHTDSTWWRNAGLSAVRFITRLFSFAEYGLISLEFTIASLLNPR